MARPFLPEIGPENSSHRRRMMGYTFTIPRTSQFPIRLPGGITPVYRQINMGKHRPEHRENRDPLHFEIEF